MSPIKAGKRVDWRNESHRGSAMVSNRHSEWLFVVPIADAPRTQISSTCKTLNADFIGAWNERAGTKTIGTYLHALHICVWLFPWRNSPRVRQAIRHGQQNWSNPLLSTTHTLFIEQSILPQCVSNDDPGHATRNECHDLNMEHSKRTAIVCWSHRSEGAWRVSILSGYRIVHFRHVADLYYLIGFHYDSFNRTQFDAQLEEFYVSAVKRFFRGQEPDKSKIDWSALIVEL